MVTVDVCVVGAGLAGLTTALEICRRGLSVVLVEAENVASGASGRNGGFVSAGFAQGILQVANRVGIERARQLYDLSRMGVRYIRDQINAFESAILMGTGCLSILRYEDGGESHLSVRHARDDLDHEFEYWPKDKVREAFATSRYHSAVYEPDAFHIHPLNYALALADEIECHGGRIFENSPGLRLARVTGGVELLTPKGKVRAGQIVLCTGPGKGLLPALSRCVLPVATHVVVSAPFAGISDECIRTSAAIADSRRAGDYYRIVGEDRLLWGGKITTRRTPPRRLPEIMKKTIVGVYPQLARIEIEYGWSGLMSYCLHKMPVIGELEPGIWAATGFGGNGLNTTAMAGCLVASAITEGDERWRLFAPYSPVWAGGPFGQLGVQCSYWWMQARDYRDERWKSS